MHVVRGSTRPDGVIWALQLILIKYAALRPPNHSKFPRTAVDIGLEAIQSEDFHIELCSPGESASNHLKRLHRKSAVKTTIAACIATEPSTTPLSQCHEPLLVPFPPKWCSSGDSSERNRACKPIHCSQDKAACMPYSRYVHWQKKQLPGSAL